LREEVKKLKTNKETVDKMTRSKKAGGTKGEPACWSKITKNGRLDLEANQKLANDSLEAALLSQTELAKRVKTLEMAIWRKDEEKFKAGAIEAARVEAEVREVEERAARATELVNVAAEARAAEEETARAIEMVSVNFEATDERSS
jgi:hypothetical protein